VIGTAAKDVKPTQPHIASSDLVKVIAGL